MMLAALSGAARHSELHNFLADRHGLLAGHHRSLWCLRYLL
jgi:hypothetical protein